MRPARPLMLAIAAVALWINASEVVRYFGVVMPMMRDAFPDLPDVAPMSVGVFAIWALWDSVLVALSVAVTWLALDRFGDRAPVAVLGATALWVATFWILWVGLWNMNLAPGRVVAVALPLSWLELVAAALIFRAVSRRARSAV